MPEFERRKGVTLLVVVFAVAMLIASLYLPSSQIPGNAASSSPPATGTTHATAPFGLTSATVATAVSNEVLETCFSPHGGCASVLVRYWDQARNSILVAIYSFTLDTLSDALIRAHNRGVTVKVIFDNVQVNIQGSEYNTLVAAGIEVRIDKVAPLMHDKVSIIDGQIVITGSYNYSANAEENRENLVVISSVSVAMQYAQEWREIWNESSA